MLQGDLYQVHIKSGLKSSSELVNWANHPAILAAFPEIDEQLTGTEFSTYVLFKDGEWIKSGGQKKAGRAPRPIPDELKERNTEFLKLPSPTVEEVKKILAESHGVNQKRPWPIPCVDLPGGSKLPVDKTLFGYYPVHYSVAIFNNKKRRKNDPIVTKTLPYLNRLEQFGILQKRKGGVEGKGKDAGKVYTADVYELSEIYRDKLDDRYAKCLPLGKPSVEFVELKILPTSPSQIPGRLIEHQPAFQYKLRVFYRNPPEWMNDAGLTGWWGEMKGTITHGFACKGSFNFDRIKRERKSGSGSCWWAFDSYQNY